MGCHKKILFLGNSYIFRNDLPNMLKELAHAGGHDLVVDSVTKGGARLQEFAAEGNELHEAFEHKFKASAWDFVVLQEQSQIPAVPELREEMMYPSVRALNKLIEVSGGKTVLFMTWGRHYGDAETGYKSFESMQEALAEGYTAIAEEIKAMLIPAGIAWAKAKKIDDKIELWNEDFSHPTVMGTYLTACVFYAVILRQSPVGIDYLAGLTKDKAEFLQRIAYESAAI